MFYSWIQVSNNPKIYIFAKKKFSFEKEIQLMFATNFKFAIRDTRYILGPVFQSPFSDGG